MIFLFFFCARIQFKFENLFFYFGSNHRRKWLPPPLRKLSQGKVDKTTTPSSSSSSTPAAATPNERPFLKKGSEKSFKLATTVTAEEEQPLPKTNINRFRDKSNADYSQKTDHDQQHPSHSADVENEEEVILPPPMKPIQDSQACINNGPTAVASSVIEQSPCKRVSYHKQFSIFFFKFSANNSQQIHFLLDWIQNEYSVMGIQTTISILSILRIFIFRNYTMFSILWFQSFLIILNKSKIKNFSLSHFSYW